MTDEREEQVEDSGKDALGVDPEDTSSEITRPFDPNKIRVRSWTPTVDLLMKRIKEGEIDLAPDFQRKAGIWKDKTQSQLIESILIRMPLPAFYIDGIDEDHMAVIDGIQRLTALKRFILDGALRLTGMEFLADLGGKSFADLPRSLQRRIEETQVHVNIIEKGTPVDAKLNLFKRINTGGLSLSAQEIRHAINPGPARGFLRDLADSEEFRRATVNSMSPDRMDDRECVLRFAAFVLTTPEGYKGYEFDSFLNQAMKTVNQMSDEQRVDLARRFRRAMVTANAIFGNKAFRKLFEGGRRGPINKALFEAWSVNLDACDDQQIEALKSRSEKLVDMFISALVSNPDFDRALSQGTGDRRKVELRFQTVADLIKGALA